MNTGTVLLSTNGITIYINHIEIPPIPIYHLHLLHMYIIILLLRQHTCLLEPIPYITKEITGS